MNEKISVTIPENNRVQVIVALSVDELRTLADTFDRSDNIESAIWCFPLPSGECLTVKIQKKAIRVEMPKECGTNKSKKIPAETSAAVKHFIRKSIQARGEGKITDADKFYNHARELERGPKRGTYVEGVARSVEVTPDEFARLKDILWKCAMSGGSETDEYIEGILVTLGLRHEEKEEKDSCEAATRSVEITPEEWDALANFLWNSFKTGKTLPSGDAAVEYAHVILKNLGLHRKE